MANYLMGIDNGGTLTKAAIYDFSGGEIAIAEKRIEMVFPRPGHTERDLSEVWQANVGAIRDALSLSGVSPDDIAAVAITGHGNGIYFIGDDGTVPERGINSTDTRAQEFIARWREDGTSKRAYERSLIDLYPAQPPALLAWYQQERPELLEKVRWFVSCKDYVRYKITGQINTEVTDLSGTGLVNAWTKSLDPEIFKLYGIEEQEEKVPPTIASDQIGGYVTPGAAAETGLSEGTPVAGGLFDIVGAAIASGVTEPGLFCVVGGTWSINEFISTEPLSSAELSMHCQYCMPEYYLVPEASPTSASNLEWFVSNLLSRADDPPEQRQQLFAECNAAVEANSPEDSDIVFFPYLFGSNTIQSASAAFVGLSGWNTKGQIIRAVYEGVAFSHKVHMDRLLAHAPVLPKSIRAAGGITKSPVWLQMFADVLGYPVETTESSELGALGAAMAAGVAAGIYSSFEDAAHKTVRVDDRFEPIPSNSEVYKKKYERFLSDLEKMTALWASHVDAT